MKQAKTKQKAILGGKLPSIAALSAALSFTLLLFSPVLVYLDGAEAFMVDLRHIFFPTNFSISVMKVLTSVNCLYTDANLI